MTISRHLQLQPCCSSLNVETPARIYMSIQKYHIRLVTSNTSLSSRILSQGVTTADVPLPGPHVAVTKCLLPAEAFTCLTYPCDSLQMRQAGASAELSSGWHERHLSQCSGPACRHGWQGLAWPELCGVRGCQGETHLYQSHNK